MHSKEYLDFYKLFKKPSFYIPKNLIDLYYIKSFDVYLNMKNKLVYESTDKILRKIRDGLTYKDYSPYNEYLDLVIYYYKINKYLKNYNINYLTLKERIY